MVPVVARPLRHDSEESVDEGRQVALSTRSHELIVLITVMRREHLVALLSLIDSEADALKASVGDGVMRVCGHHQSGCGN